jgi:hypothetical protein
MKLYKKGKQNVLNNDSYSSYSPTDTTIRLSSLATYSRVNHAYSNCGLSQHSNPVMESDSCRQCEIPLDPNKYGPPDGYPRYCSPRCAKDDGGYYQGTSNEYKKMRKQRRDSN